MLLASRVQRKETILRLLLACVLLLAGCGGGNANTSPVKGKVTYNNKPVPSGTITFIPAAGQGPTATGTLQPDGSYVLRTYRDGDGAVRGKHTVIVVAMQDTSSSLPEARSGTPPPIVPLKYTSVATTDLTATVEDKENVFNFDLQDATPK
jgi:hypothetical protein